MLDRLVSILPASQRDKVKAYVAWLGTVATIVTLIIPEAPSWLTAAVVVLTALGVYGAPNPGYQYPPAPTLAPAPGPGSVQAVVDEALARPVDPLDGPNEDYEPRH